MLIIIKNKNVCLSLFSFYIINHNHSEIKIRYKTKRKHKKKKQTKKKRLYILLFLSKPNLMASSSSCCPPKSNCCPVKVVIESDAALTTDQCARVCCTSEQTLYIKGRPAFAGNMLRICTNVCYKCKCCETEGTTCEPPALDTFAAALICVLQGNQIVQIPTPEESVQFTFMQATPTLVKVCILLSITDGFFSDVIDVTQDFKLTFQVWCTCPAPLPPV